MYPHVLLLAALALGTVSAAPPNFVLIFADDLGFGDLGCYGHPSSLTPNLDRLAAGGLRFTDFYVTSASCSPSRASLLTGRYQTRSGVYPGVFYPSSIGGLPLNETTIAEVLKPRGYSTAAMGKWHLGFGTNGTFLPVRQGFDHYLGIPYSHDQGPCNNMTCFYPDGECFGTCDQQSVVVPLMKDDIIIEQPISFIDLEKSYSDFGVNFIKSSVKKNQPFFLYYPAHHTHYPQYAGKGAVGRSLRGPFGDSLLELDDTIGQLMETLRESGVIKNTLVFFTADNGPQLSMMSRGGNSGPLKCGKGTTYEGGMRMPTIAYWPETIKPGVTHELASTLDLLPTFAKLANATLPNVTLDGVDMIELLTNHGKSKREAMMFYPIRPNKIHGLFAIRLGKYKAHYYTEGNGRSGSTPDHNCSLSLKFHHPPLLFDLEADASENYPLNITESPDLQKVVKEIWEVKLQFEAKMVFGDSQIDKGKDPNLEPCCRPQCSPKPECCHC